MDRDFIDLGIKYMGTQYIKIYYTGTQYIYIYSKILSQTHFFRKKLGQGRGSWERRLQCGKEPSSGENLDNQQTKLLIFFKNYNHILYRL